MRVGLLEAPVDVGTHDPGGDGGLPARRAVVRWAWRLFRREWRQQVLVLALIVVAVAATFIGSAVATNQPPPANSGFGTAQDSVTYPGASDHHLLTQIAALQQHVGTIDVIANESLRVPGSVSTYDLRSQNPHGAYGGPMLQLLSGHYPTSAHQVAMTATLASDFNLRVGQVWHAGGQSRTLVGIVQNPQSLLDEFALVIPGQVTTPTQVTVLLDAGTALKGLNVGATVSTPGSVAQGNVLNPETISLTVLTIGMLLIALMSIGGFTVLAQRRMRSLGMLASLGATSRNVSLVVRANGAVVGVVGALLGTVLGFVAWLAYRPHLEQSAHHLIGLFALPWAIVITAFVLAILATYFAASRPARAIAKVPVVAALSGRPAPPRQIHRSALPGIAFLVGAFLLLGYAGSSNSGNGSGGMPELVLGIVLLIPGVILLAPFCLSVLARLGRRSPIAVRLALRDLARYRARSGSALAAISIGVLIAVIIALVAAARYGNVLDYAGPNVASNQIVVWTPNGQGGGPNSPAPIAGASQQQMHRAANAIGTALGAQHVVGLETTNANMQSLASGNGRSWNGALYVGTPQLLSAFGISPTQIDAGADILSARPGLSGASNIGLTYNPPSTQSKGGTINPGSGGGGPNSGATAQSCTAANYCVIPVIQEVPALPSGTSAPNTVVTEYAITKYHLASTVSPPVGWLIQTAQPITAVQIRNAEAAASAAGMTIESKNDQPTSSEVIDWATVFGIALALGILAMSVGLIRSETAGDLRTLTAAGASSYTRRTITAATAGALGLLGAVLGTFAGYVGVIGFLRSNSLNGGIASLGNIPVDNLLFILIGMPLIATAVGWVLAGRSPSGVTRQPIE